MENYEYFFRYIFNMNEASPIESVALKPYETIVHSDAVDCFDQYSGKIDGKVFITNISLIFLSNHKSSKSVNESKQSENRASEIPSFIINTPLANVEKISKNSVIKQPSISHFIEICCRDFRNIKFIFDSENDSFKKLHDIILTLAFPTTVESFPAYINTEEFKHNGWEIYDPLSEYARMSVPNDLWRITHINKGYTFCSTYPEILAVPKNISDDDLSSIKEFRSRDRIPVLSWVHPKNQCTITRASQPLTAAVKRSKDDELYIQGILDASPSCHKLIIIDARPKLNAVVNQAMGGGYEAIKNYSNASIIFLDIANIHVMRESYSKLKEICLSSYDDPNWYSLLESTKWLSHISKIMSGAAKVAENVDRNRTSVMVHCSDGWDRTPQLTCLAMLFLDPYYRTITGFEVLIEKEWCSFGHKFDQRYGICNSNIGDDQRSPVFMQFIDCTWQFMQQFPCAFEFTENLLIQILQLMFSASFGTFYFDSQSKRDSMDIKNKTVSIWSAINSKLSNVYNPLYAPERFPNVILPVPTIPYIKLWKSYYFKWNPLIKPKINYERVYNTLIEKHDMCVKHLKKLKSQIDEQTTLRIQDIRHI